MLYAMAVLDQGLQSWVSGRVVLIYAVFFDSLYLDNKTLATNLTMLTECNTETRNTAQPRRNPETCFKLFINFVSSLEETFCWKQA